MAVEGLIATLHNYRHFPGKGLYLGFMVKIILKIQSKLTTVQDTQKATQ
jgi:hypothetical protein